MATLSLRSEAVRHASLGSAALHAVAAGQAHGQQQCDALEHRLNPIRARAEGDLQPLAAEAEREYATSVPHTFGRPLNCEAPKNTAASAGKSRPGPASAV